VIETGDDSAAALRFLNAYSVRLDAGTRIRVLSTTAVALDRGALYADSSAPGSALTVRTFLGDCVPAGTQFEVRAGDDVLLRVREGRVAARGVTVAAGEQLIIGRDGSLHPSAIRRDDPRWGWASRTAPIPDIEGRTLRSFLDWVGRENGWTVAFRDPNAAVLSDKIILHGSVANMTPEEALLTIARSSGFEYTIGEGRLTVTMAADQRHSQETPAEARNRG
jgi:hypothetical protein